MPQCRRVLWIGRNDAPKPATVRLACVRGENLNVAGARVAGSVFVLRRTQQAPRLPRRICPDQEGSMTTFARNTLSRFIAAGSTAAVLSAIAIGAHAQQTPPDGSHKDPPGQSQFLVPGGCPEGWSRVPPSVNPALRCLPGHLAPSGRADPTATQPAKCPADWVPVSPRLNPVLHCQPASLSAAVHSSRGKAVPIGCPDGWRPVAPDVNRLLRCLPANMAAMRPVESELAGCPSGWEPVPATKNRMMRCLPVGHVAAPRVGPEQGEPVEATPTPRR